MKTNIKPFELPEDIRQELRDMKKYFDKRNRDCQLGFDNYARVESLFVKKQKTQG